MKIIRGAVGIIICISGILVGFYFVVSMISSGFGLFLLLIIGVGAGMLLIGAFNPKKMPDPDPKINPESNIFDDNNSPQNMIPMKEHDFGGVIGKTLLKKPQEDAKSDLNQEGVKKPKRINVPK